MYSFVFFIYKEKHMEDCYIVIYFLLSICIFKIFFPIFRAS